MKKESLNAFNDGVIAIIVTLMVLEIKLPEMELHALRPMLQHIGIYAISFVITSIFWLNLHTMLDPIESLTPRTTWLNLLFLFCLSLLPLPTEAVGENPHSVIAHIFLGTTLTLCALLYALLHLSVQNQWNRLSNELKRSLLWKNWVAVIAFAAAIPLAYLSTWISLAIFILVPAAYFLPSRHLASTLQK